jgi:hypothetical protein
MGRPKDRLALDQFKNLILPVMKMSRRPEAGRSAIVKNGELPTAVGGANPDVRLLAPRCPRHNARRCCSINRDRARSNSLGRHACSFLLLMRDSPGRRAPIFDVQMFARTVQVSGPKLRMAVALNSGPIALLVHRECDRSRPKIYSRNRERAPSSVRRHQWRWRVSALF